MDHNSIISKAEVWEKLLRGTDPKALDRIRKAERLDVRRLHIAEPRTTEILRTRLADLGFLEGITTIRGVNWEDIDFTDSQLPGLRLYESKLSNCIFKRCELFDLRVWGTKFLDVSFASAYLRGAVLGGVLDGRRNCFTNVDFTRADLRETIYVSADFQGCNFINSKLQKIDFQSSTFSDCIFEGELREVVFSRVGFRGGNFPENAMKNIDFSKARLRWVEFHNLDLEEITFPEDADHVIIASFPEILDRLIKKFGGRADLGSRRLCSRFLRERKRLGTKQRVGVFNKTDLRELGGEEGLEAVLETVADVSA